MKTTTLRILFTLAILAGLAAAPNAQTFHWQAGGRTDAAERAQAAIDRAMRNAQRQIERAQINAEREAERATRNAQLRADHIRRQVERSIDAQVRAQVRSQVRINRVPSMRMYRGFSGYSGSAMQDFSVDPCRERNYNRDREEFCEVRDESMAAGPITVNASPNGGISVQGWDRNDIKVQAVVHAFSEDAGRAQQLAREVRVLVGGGRVSAEGPTQLRNEWWSVDFRINVPHKNDLDLSANNGGITIKNVAGNMKFDTSNGGVTLTDLGGSVRGSTRNGGLNVLLGGSRWDGEGIDVQTTNGGVTLAIPDNYNAQLETRTVNGGLTANYPLTITGELSTRRGISTTLGSGGPTVRVSTTNGGLKIGRR